jgi:hypothetical protein
MMATSRIGPSFEPAIRHLISGFQSGTVEFTGYLICFTPRSHSLRNAAIGSAFVARRAGM